MNAATKTLLAKLDPARNYGDRSFATVKREVKAGTLSLTKGANLPQIRDVATGLTVTGTGANITDADPRRVTMAMFQSRSTDDIDWFYDKVRESINKLDVRAMKLWAEINGLVGNSRDPRAVEMDSALANLIERAAKSIPVAVSQEFIDVKSSDV